MPWHTFHRKDARFWIIAIANECCPGVRSLVERQFLEQVDHAHLLILGSILASGCARDVTSDKSKGQGSIPALTTIVLQIFFLFVIRHYAVIEK